MNRTEYAKARLVARRMRMSGATKRRVAAWCKFMRAALKG